MFYIGLIFFLSSLNISSIHKLSGFGLDKMLHLMEYGVLSCLLARAFKRTTSLGYKKSFLIILALGFLIAGLDEYYQSFVPLRESSFLDFIFDLAGIISGVIIFERIRNDRN